jgi:membrane-associated protease RseP (regulator of RpoE activity)
MKKSTCILFGAIVVLAVCAGMGPTAAVAQTALERVESRLRQQLGGDAKQAAPATPPQPQSPAAGEARPAKGGGWLGVVADDENDRGRGVRVLEITPNGPAAKAGFRVQDLITSVGGIRVRQMSELADMVGLYKPGDVVNFEVQRGGKVEKFPATLGERPAQPGETPAATATPALPGVPRVEPKSEAPLLLPSQTAPAAPPAMIPAATGDDRSRVEALEHRIQQLEQRVADLERALKQSPPPAK